MRSYWDQSAQRNAVWYVDTSLDYAQPDMERFFATGEVIVAEALDGAPIAPPGRKLAVEIGPGLGRVCQALAGRFEEVLGVDVSPEMVARAGGLVTDPRVRFVVGSGSGLDGVADASADLVLSFTVFQHIPDPAVIESYIVDAGRVLRPEGLLVFQWNNQPRPRLWAARRLVLSTGQRLGLGERRRRHDAAFLGARVPLTRIDAALRRGGLERVAVKGEGTLWAWAWAVRR